MVKRNCTCVIAKLPLWQSANQPSQSPSPPLAPCLKLKMKQHMPIRTSHQVPTASAQASPARLSVQSAEPISSSGRRPSPSTSTRPLTTPSSLAPDTTAERSVGLLAPSAERSTGE